ncbi:hypothetical protein [Gilvimarinus sp. 1_MG-2023]|uniref:hypothetical protein n=1 Tax=Gilvimarinus sp. 1_MG-2023 TaxID=3062638 RepID=UPI0026E205E8|nr:hypothetical protein [Gilvimarinus sp. 1_MG-2023]MDO6747619.1 hypothetical protein [Gilvimarinus sp. 1_MG-2023]
MKKTTQIGLLALTALCTLPACAASDNASQAIKHSGLAAGHSAVAGAKVVSGAVATPMIVVGEVGKAAGKAGDVMMDFALEDAPLEVSDKVIIADPAPRHLPKRDGGI